MTLTDNIELLGQNAVFQGLPVQALQKVRQAARVQHWQKNLFLVRQGEPASASYVLTGGHAKLIQATEDGHQVLMRYIGPGQEFGLIAALSGLEYPLSVQAVEDCRALVWPGEVLAQLMEQYVRIAFNALHIMVRRNQEMQRRYQELLTEHVDQRIAQALLRLAEQLGRWTEDGLLIDLALTREDLAELAGTTLYTASRTLSRWEQNGYVCSGRERVVIRQMEALERLASLQN
jgi:CRP-like cAMP-binding protein